MSESAPSGKPRLANQVAVVTGGARGIGAGIVKRFVEEGARVVFSDLLDDKAKQLEKELGANVAFCRADSMSPSDIEALMSFGVTRFGKLDCVVNNAGAGGEGGPIAETSVEGFDRSIALLLRGTFLGIKCAVPRMQSGGTIINIASVAGIMASGSPHAYVAAKFGVVGLTKSVALELAERGIRVNRHRDLGTGISRDASGTHRSHAGDRGAMVSGAHSDWQRRASGRHRKRRTLARKQRVKLCNRTCSCSGWRVDRGSAMVAGPRQY
jgi:3alpha(or 20beta)-hydroxysteroid dehydrogenase